MDARDSSPQGSSTVTWPLIGSLILTGIVVALVCVPPFSGLHSFGRLVWLACVYMLVAACVHALAVWSVYRIQSEGVRDWAMVWPVVWGAWIAVVWLPLVALLTYERSSWVAAIVPLAAAFLTLFVVSRHQDEDDDATAFVERRAELLAVDESPRLWRMLLPSLVIAMVVDGGVALYAANHAWMAGVLFAVAAAYVTERQLTRTAARVKVRDESVRRGAAGNSVAVWMLTVVALLPFLAGMGLAMRGVLGMPAARAANYVPKFAHAPSRDSTGIILVRPKVRQAIVTPLLTATSGTFKKSDVIKFDGQYWYFQAPDNEPGVDAHVAKGDPTKVEIKSTNNLAVMMEAHQRLPREMEADCCRELQLNVVNADAVPGTISVEVVLRDSSKKPAKSVSLGSMVLASSTVSPMPLKRAPVHETLTFEIPRRERQAFNEITVKVKPEFARALETPQVAVESFAFQR
ncbi:MAG TPA: hypothetical protein VFA99_17895 [Acidobacteriaceae bacterium]|nr:hypothetical protein [Acidobacteriaceae bacterium]